MLKMEIPVTVQSVKTAKDEKSNNYADFLFVGGLISIPIDRTLLERLKPLEGSEVKGVFQMKPAPVVRFGRAVSIFEPMKLIEIVK